MAAIRKAGVGVVLALAAPLCVHAGPEDPEDGGQWGPVLTWPHIAVSAANLPDGRILTWSGSERETWPTTEQTYSATWDPATGEFVEIFHDNHNMFCAHLAMLEDGRVFVNGGRNQTNSPWTSIFDFRDNGWLQIENMESGGRWYPTTLALADGDIMTSIGTASLQRYPERWNIDSGWEIQNGVDFNEMVLTDYFSSGTHGESRWWPLLHVAPNGQVFHSGPTPKMHYIDPAGNGSFQQVGPEMTDFYHKHGTTIMYDEGKLLTAGGWVNGSDITSTNRAFTIDINGPTPVVAATESMQFARKFHNGIMLPTGEVLVIGGNTSGRKFNDSGTIYAVEIWNPDTGTWRTGASMATPRNYHSIALLLTDGRVLAAGGGYCSGSAFCNGASHMDGEVYSPPYLFNADGTPAIQPEITSGPARVQSGNTFAVTGTPGMTAFSMIKMSSTTHGLNTDVRFVEVAFTETSPGTYELTAHANRNVLTPGYWMLFGLNANGVPSVAHVVQANTSGQPWIAAMPQQSSQEGEAVNVAVTAGDTDDDLLVYSASGLPAGLGIDSATGRITGAATTAGIYTVTVEVTDNDEGTRSRSFDWLVFGQGLGSIRRDWWTGIGGTAIDDLTSNANYPQSPTGSDSLTSFEAPTNWADSYGTRVHGYLSAPASGDYVFAIATDDAGELWLSTDSNPANRQLIANVPGWAGPREWSKFPEQQSAPVTLVAGETYFIEALQKEGGGGDNLAVGWIRPGESSIEVIPGAVLSPDNVAIEAPTAARLHSGVLPNVGSNWVTVDLPDVYDDMVVVATPAYTSSDLPVVTRVRTSSADSFEVRVQNPGGGAVSANYSVHYLVAEKGVYSGDGVKLEVASIDAPPADNDSSWNGQAVAYQQTYVEPVVVGQVIGDADAEWSVFWASDGTTGNPPSAATLHVGRHVGEDINLVRSGDALGYMVFGAGNAGIGEWLVEAALGTNTVAGMGDAPPYGYALAADAEVAVLSAAGMNGVNGGWPVLYGPSPLIGTSLSLAYDEDQIGDSERGHATEEVAYVALARVPDEPLSLDPITTTASVTGSDISFDGVANGGTNLVWNWNFGDGSPETGFGNFPSVSHSYGTPGRYVISVTVRDLDTGEEITYQFVQLVHWPLTVNAPTSSSTIALNEVLGQVWSVNPDNDTVTVITDVAMGTAVELATGKQPVAVQIAPDGSAWVVNRKSASISVFDGGLQPVATIALAAGSAPYGIAFHAGENVAYVVQEGTGDLLKLDASTRTLLSSVYVGDNARHVAVSADGATVLVTRFITPTLPDEWTAAPIVESGGQKYGGEVVVVEPFAMSVESTVVLQHSDRVASEHTGPGVPNYLGPAVVSPDGRSAWIPSKQDNILAGALRGGQGMTFDQTVRAITSKVDLVSGLEDFTARVDHDNASVGKYAAFGPYGAYLFTSLEGNREIAVSDAYTATELGRFDVGRAPHGVATSSDGTTLYVHNFMDRSIGVYDVSALSANNEFAVVEINTISTVANETLAADVLLGKQLFYDARDPRLALDSYMSCASCHNDGGQDGRIWDFTGVGEGLRNTIMLRGRAATAHGFLHWSANFDELQDFEDQIRNFSMGTGLMDDADYVVGTRSTSLGDPKAGLSTDLDALAAYVASLDEFDDSPFRNADGTLTAEGEAGRQIFEAQGCDSCHVPPTFTDSVDASTLRDVGTIQQPTSGSRLGGTLDGIDTPTLISLWNTGPFLHDGSALDITEAVAAHSGISLTTQELNQLGAYLEQLDGVTAQIQGGDTGCPECVDFSALTLGSYSNQDAAGDFTVLDGGAGILLENNTWKRSEETYTITPDTVLEFTFESSVRGEVHGIGFDENNVHTPSNRVFQLYGTQRFGIQDFKTYGGSGPETFVIPVGQYFTGTDMALVFINDNDAGSGNQSRFTDVRVYGNIVAPPPPQPPVIDNPGSKSSRLGVTVSFQMTATDANGDDLTFGDPTGSLPPGLSINGDGLVTGVPTTLGTYPVSIEVTDGVSGSDVASFEWTVAESLVCATCVDFSGVTLSSYSNQDAAGDFTVLDGGAGILLQNNTWKRSEETYTITPNTMLEFTFESSVQGELHGIGFDEDNIHTPGNRIFQLYGTQRFGIQDFNIYSGSGPETFVIPIGQYFTGTDMALVFMNDNDAGSGNESRFTDIRLYENVVAPPPPQPPVIDNPGSKSSRLGVAVSFQMTATDANGDDLTFGDPTGSLPPGLSISGDGLVTGVPTTLGTYPVSIEVTDSIIGSDVASFEWTIAESLVCATCVDFSAITLSSYSNQDAAGDFTVLDGGAGILLENNTWKRSEETYTITPNTMLEFTFESSVQGEIQGIGFDEDNNHTPSNRVFQLYGTQRFGIQDFKTYSGSGPETFVIPIGQYFTGTDMALVFMNDDDAALGSDGAYMNVRLYEN